MQERLQKETTALRSGVTRAAAWSPLTAASGASIAIDPRSSQRTWELLQDLSVAAIDDAHARDEVMGQTMGGMPPPA
jgi:hypothetical protein